MHMPYLLPCKNLPEEALISYLFGLRIRDYWALNKIADECAEIVEWEQGHAEERKAVKCGRELSFKGWLHEQDGIEGHYFVFCER